MPKPHKFDGRPWWDDSPNPLHDRDGNRYRHRINYERLPTSPELTKGYGLQHLWSHDTTKRRKARKKLWRRLRTGFYDRNEPKQPWWELREKQAVPLCGARCRDGHACRARAVKNPITGKRKRCRMHGGKSPGPKSADGRARSLAALARGREARNRNCRLKRQLNISAVGTVPQESHMGTEAMS